MQLINRLRTTDAAFTLIGLSVSWPSLVAFAGVLFQSPLERALQSSWCGPLLHSPPVIWSHCAACWIGSATFALAAATLMRPLPIASVARARRV